VRAGVASAVSVGQSLIIELEEAIQSGSKDKRIDALRRITDLFVADADRLNDQQIDVFDDILGHLIKRIESKALAELSRRLAPIHNAPIEVVRRLARDDNIVVAEPILTASPRLSDSDLIEIASTKTQAHLLAISARPQIGTAVTDVLLQRGNQDVFHTLAENSGARFSVRGFETLVRHAESDGRLAEKVGLRLDVPLRLFRELLSRATEAVRARLLELAGPESRRHIQGVLSAIAEDAQHEARRRTEHDYAAAQTGVAALKAEGRLDDAAVFEFASKGQYAHIVTALSSLCSAPVPLVDELLQSKHREAILIACKAAELEWPTVKAVLNCRAIAGKMSDLDVDTARADFLRLSASGAQRVLRFWQVRHTVANEPSNPLAQSGLRPLRQPPPSSSRTPDEGPPNLRSEQR
jgi:uncharacterized protein (DUF2336 family)